MTCLPKVSDMQLLNGVSRAIAVVNKNIVSALHSFRAPDNRDRAQECLRNPTEKQLCMTARAAIGEQMDRFVCFQNGSHSEAYYPDRRRALWLSTMLICCRPDCASAEK